MGCRRFPLFVVQVNQSDQSIIKVLLKACLEFQSSTILMEQSNVQQIFHIFHQKKYIKMATMNQVCLTKQSRQKRTLYSPFRQQFLYALRTHVFHSTMGIYLWSFLFRTSAIGNAINALFEQELSLFEKSTHAASNWQFCLKLTGALICILLPSDNQ